MSFRLTAVYQIPSGQQIVPAGIGAGVCPKPGLTSAGPPHLAERTGVLRFLFDRTIGTNGTAFAALRPREASG